MKAGFSWVSIDDALPDHPKIDTLNGIEAMAGWALIKAICYCGRHLTDGVVPKAKMMRFARNHGVTLDGQHVTAETVIAGLVAAGLLHESGTGAYLVHDYLDYNRSRAEAERRSLRASEAAQARWGTDTTDKCAGVDEAAWGEFWMAFPKKTRKVQARTAFFEACKQTDSATIIAGARTLAASVKDGESRFTPNPVAWLNGRRWEYVVQPRLDADGDDGAYMDYVNRPGRPLVPMEFGT